MATDVELSGVLTEFARTMITDFPIQAILDRLVERIVEVLPVTAAGVTLISGGPRPRYVAASNRAALRFEQVQRDLGEGPCVEVYRTGQPVVVPDLSEDDRFARFAARASQEGLAGVFTFPLRHGGGQLGALDLYRDTPGALDDATMDAAQTLADVASAYLLNAQARTDLFASQALLRDNALHDGLTGLPNRVLLVERLEHALLRGRRSRRMLAVFFVDLDKFKEVNDVHGHQVGDEVLVAVAKRMRSLVRPGDTVARLSGDEFVIVCEDLDGTAEVGMIAERLDAELSRPFVVAGSELAISASVGIAFSGDDHIPEQVLHHADTAMYRAKRSGGARHEILDLRETREPSVQTDMAHDLGGARTRNELRLAYQPILTSAATGRAVGVEALLRWEHPNFGTLTPAMFLPRAERSGLITDIGRWVLQRACTDRALWAADIGTATVGMSLNVSAHQLMTPGFAATVAKVLGETNTDPGSLTLEVTEEAFIQDGRRALIVLSHLKDIGVSLALDDFGTGYSSLSHLRHFPIDMVKMDPSLVADITTNMTSHAIVAAVIELAHSMRMTVTAEGIETGEQHRVLDALGCDTVQGHHFARPMPIEDLCEWIRNTMTQPDRSAR